MYDYLIVGAGLFGSVIANEAKKNNKKVLVIDKRNHVGGNIYTEKTEDIYIHKYGAHIFHTNNKEIWNYINQFAEFNRFTNSPIANYRDEIYSLPFNMFTFNKMWGVVTPLEAKNKIEAEKNSVGITTVNNLEEKAISLVGIDIYEKLIKGYTEKQWGRNCKDLPSFIINRIPVRFNYDNNYFDALYQGIPIGGYTQIINKMLEGVDIILDKDYLEEKEHFNKIANKVIYTGAIDAFFEYKLGVLEYRSVKFDNEVLDCANFQGNAVVNYTDINIPWTRIIEHKWFDNRNQSKTVISKEYSIEWQQGDEPYYPVNDKKNNDLYKQYELLSKQEKNVYFGGRLGEYKYYDMDTVIDSALKLSENIFKE